MLLSIPKQRLLIFLMPLLLAAPFLNRAYFVDDSYFVEIASWIKDHPGQPYHFRADDAGFQTRGIEANGFVRMVNPLAHHYYLALLLKLGGEHEWFLRLGCVLLSCFSALFLFELARRWTVHALWAALVTLVTPVFWLTSYSLLIDGTLGFFFFGALYFFVRGIERDTWLPFIGSGVFMGLAILTKYPALLILPLTGVLLVMGKSTPKSWLRACVAWALGVGFLLAYSLWTAHLYGRAHILGASARMVESYGWPKYLVFTIFWSGATLVPLVLWKLISPAFRVWAALGAFMVAVLMHSSLGGFTVTQSFLLGLWIVTSILFFTSVGLFPVKAWRRSDWIVAAWLAGFVAMMVLVMGWVAGRYYVIVIPALVFWCVRLIETREPATAPTMLKIVFGLTLIATGLLAYADYKQAEPARQIGFVLDEAGFSTSPRHFYLGDSFTSSYLKRHGWEPCFESTELRPGDLVLSKDVTMPNIWFFKKPLKRKLLGEWNYSSRFPVRVMDNQGSAGFYASVWGALPFSISNSPWERFRLFEVEGFTNIQNDSPKQP